MDAQHAHRGPPEPLPPEQLDDYGFPWFWHRSPPDRLIEETITYWPIFERWCQERGRRAFPAARETVLDFLHDPPVRGRALYEVWNAIDMYHFAHYWHTDANPVLMLRNEVEVDEEGTVTVREDPMRFERWGHRFEGVYRESSQLRERPGLYLVLCMVVYDYGSFWKALAVGYADNVRAAATAPDQEQCYNNHCRGVVHYAALYDIGSPDGTLSRLRRAILEEQDDLPCEG